MGSLVRLAAGAGAHAPSSLSQHLEHARSRLEERFLEGGAVLAGALDSIGTMIASLDRVMASLGKDAVDATVSDIGATNRELLTLPQGHAARQASMRDLSVLVTSLQPPVDKMLETLRYLRTLAVSVKITGAGAAAFASFADEMLEKIHSGREQVDEFSDRLNALAHQVRHACSSGEDLQRQYENVVPSIARDLEADARRMSDYHGEVMAIARQLAELARQVQGKVANVLSALQIGDMTRQRVEHVQAGLALLDETGDTQARAVILRLLSAQMEDLLDEFKERCAVITSSLGGIAGDSKEVMSLGRRASGNKDGGTFLKALQTSLTTARRLVGQVEESGCKAETVRGDVASTAGELSAAVDNIRAIRNEIQYMTINTSLRCSRMGDAGKPMNVIATELRVFSEQMETVSGFMMERLGALSDATAALAAGAQESGGTVGSTLDNALSTVSAAGGSMEEELKKLTATGDQVARDITHSVSRLDFTHELGEILEDCSLAMTSEAADAEQAQTDPQLSEETLAIAQRLFASYTMARERDIHRHYVPSDAAATTQQAGGEDDLEDCLF